MSKPRAESAPEPRPSLLGMTLDEMTEAVTALGEPSFRARQIYGGIFARGIPEIDGITDLSKTLRATLAERFSVARPAIDQVQISSDGTRKFLFKGNDGAPFEAVFIPEVAKGRKTNTLCVSSQTGCAVGCTFCFTASLRRNRDLTTAEIVGQVLAVSDTLRAEGLDERITNIVFMGMGEPLLNYDQVVRAIRVLCDPVGFDFSTRRITVSTAGIVPRIYDLGRDVATQLAISLNATTNEVRDRIMPINKKWPIEKLIEALHAYPLPKRRRITIEYVLLGGVNDSVDDAKRLVRLLAGLRTKINLLPLNAHERTELSPPSAEAVARFQQVLLDRHQNAILRTPRGRDIAAACGQLGGQATGAPR